jgi:hypothetical protein
MAGLIRRIRIRRVHRRKIPVRGTVITTAQATPSTATIPVDWNRRFVAVSRASATVMESGGTAVRHIRPVHRRELAIHVIPHRLRSRSPVCRRIIRHRVTAEHRHAGHMARPIVRTVLHPGHPQPGIWIRRVVRHRCRPAHAIVAISISRRRGIKRDRRIRRGREPSRRRLRCDPTGTRVVPVGTRWQRLSAGTG